MFDIPILLICYKRLDSITQILTLIEKINPIRLYISIDYPKDYDTTSILQHEQVVKFLDTYPAKFEVFRNQQTVNKGPGLGPKMAIDWFFQHETMGIILEDDCLPDISFFEYCRKLLIRYSNQPNIFMISGNNYVNSKHLKGFEYYYTKYPNIWGWATWKRAWVFMDQEMDKYIDFIEEHKLASYCNSNAEYDYWNNLFNNLYIRPDKLDFWDYQWLFTIWNNNGMGIAPPINLVRNIGFESSASHTKSIPHWYNKISHGSFDVLNYNDTFEINQDADNYQLENIINNNIKHSIVFKLASKIKKLFSLQDSPPTNEWRNKEYFDPQWEIRIKLMSAYIEPNDKIIDLGCGKMWLRKYIGKQNTYIGVDYTNRGTDTLVCDFNKKEYPEINTDVTFVSGCLEYIEDVEWFISNIQKHTKRCILSYCTTDNFSDLKQRESFSWKNHLSEVQLLDLFKAHGFHLTDKNITPSKNSIYNFSNRK